MLQESLEQCELGFMRDARPWREVAIWEKIVAVKQRFCKERPGLSDEQKRNLLIVIVRISMGERDVDVQAAILNGGVNELRSGQHRIGEGRNVARRLIKFYEALPIVEG
jgi:hypothetical protein